MGRIKGTHIKAVTEFVVDQSPESFSPVFGENKKILESIGLNRMGKTERNKLAGEISVTISRLDKIAQSREQEEKKRAAPAAEGASGTA